MPLPKWKRMAFIREAAHSTDTVFRLDICKSAQLVFTGELFMIKHHQLVPSLINRAMCNCNTVDGLQRVATMPLIDEGLQFSCRLHAVSVSGRARRLAGIRILLASCAVSLKGKASRRGSPRSKSSIRAELSHVAADVHSHGKFTNRSGKVTVPAEEKLTK